MGKLGFFGRLFVKLADQRRWVQELAGICMLVGFLFLLAMALKGC